MFPWESFCNIQERKKKQIKIEFMNTKQFLERHVPPAPNDFFFTTGFVMGPFGIF